MSEFTDALLNNVEDRIPEEYDWFKPLIGEWDFEYYDSLESDYPRHVVGEWIFRKILQGTGVEDLFICPSRATMKENPQEDGEYGVALRMFNFNQKCYDMVYACATYMIRVTFVKEDDMLVGTILEVPNNRFVFYDIEKDSFKWKNIEILENGSEKQLSQIIARRK